MQTKDLILRKARFEDWQDMYRNVWSHGQTARFMLWQVTASEEAAKRRMERTVAFQQTNHAWLVYEKLSAQAMGFAGMVEVETDVYEDCGIAVGPAFTGRGYGKQILRALTEYAFVQLGAKRFIASCRSENGASRGMLLGCGFHFTHCEDRVDPRDGTPYVLEFYEKERDIL